MTPLEPAVTVPDYFVTTVEVHDPVGFSDTQPYSGTRIKRPSF